MWFLRCFAAFRLLEARLGDALIAGMRDERETLYLRQQIDVLQGIIASANHEAIQAVKTLANERWQRQYGTHLYEDVAHIPEARTLPSEPGSVQPAQTSVRIQQVAAMKQFQKEAAEQWEAAHPNR